MTIDTGYIAFSYNTEFDGSFVAKVADTMQRRGIATWYLPEMVKPSNITTEQYLGGDFDWRDQPQNWLAVFVEHLKEAKGIIVVLSANAHQSSGTYHRGMWRERPAVDFIREDNPVRVREIGNTLNDLNSESELFDDLVEWGKMVLALPLVQRQLIGDPNSFNTPTGEKGPLQLPELKTSVSAWYELVRLDLYDAQWHCRRCSLNSYPYIMSHENPPKCCPRCGFSGFEPEYDAKGLSRLAGQYKPLNNKDDALGLVQDSIKVVSLSKLALESQQSGKHDEAMKLNFELERLCRKLGYLEPIAEAYGDQAQYLHQHEQLDWAVELYGHAERLCRELGDKIHLQQYLGNVGTILIDYGKLDKALVLLKEQETINRELENENNLEKSLGNQAMILVKQGQGGKAMQLLKEQERICREMGKHDGLMFSLNLQKQIDNGESG